MNIAPQRSVSSIRIPDELSARPLPGIVFDYVILGAGCAGLSFCLALLAEGVVGPIVLLDRRTDYTDDRTWCFWEVEPTPFSHLATARWNRWSVRTASGTVTASSADHPYLCITGADFYRFALETLARHPNVTVILDCSVIETLDGPLETVVEIALAAAGNGIVPSGSPAAEFVRARTVIDARGLSTDNPLFERARSQSQWVPQLFVGQRIRTTVDVFDSSTCTMMDFTVGQQRGAHFLYVLPLSSREALVETVYFSEPGLTVGQHRAEIAEYLAETYGVATSEYVVDSEERGYIPMTDFSFPVSSGARTHFIGMAGGGTRPSTGYTFVRIQRSARELARSLTGGRAPARVQGARRLALLDSVFLRFIIEFPLQTPRVFERMFSRTPTDALIRFLSEKSTVSDELRLIVALPKALFLTVALHAALQWIRESAGRRARHAGD